MQRLYQIQAKKTSRRRLPPYGKAASARALRGTLPSQLIIFMEMRKLMNADDDSGLAILCCPGTPSSYNWRIARNKECLILPELNPGPGERLRTLHLAHLLLVYDAAFVRVAWDDTLSIYGKD